MNDVIKQAKKRMAEIEELLANNDLPIHDQEDLNYEYE